MRRNLSNMRGMRIALFVVRFSLVMALSPLCHADMDRVRLENGQILHGVVLEEGDSLTIVLPEGMIRLSTGTIQGVSKVEPDEAWIGLAEAQLVAGKAAEASRTVTAHPAGTIWQATFTALCRRIDQRLSPPRITVSGSDFDQIVQTLRVRNRKRSGLVNLAYPPDDEWGIDRDLLHLILARKALDRFNRPAARRHLDAISQESPLAQQAAELREALEARREGRRPDRTREPKTEPDAPGPSELDARQLVEAWPTRARVTPELVSLVIAVASELEVPPSLALAVVECESGWDPTAVSVKGAQGLMQLMPATARELGVENSFDPEQNVRAGVSYLAALLDLYEDDKLALAAYNAGPRRISEYGGVPPYKETQAFVRKTESLSQRLNPMLSGAIR